MLDWELSDLNNQVEHADLVMTKGGIKYLLLEIKRPGALAWNQRAVERALVQAIGYAIEQHVMHGTDAEHEGVTFSPHWLRFAICPCLLKHVCAYPNHQERGSCSLPSSSPIT